MSTDILPTEQYLLSPELPPRHIAQVTPKMTLDGSVINSALHTDNLGRLMRLLLNSENASSQIQIRVRLLTPKTWKEIQADPLFKLFLGGRYERVKYIDNNQKEIVDKGFITPRGVSFTAHQIKEYLSKGQRPETLAEEKQFDYQVGFIPVDELKKIYLERTANGLMPFLGGCTTFEIGSDTLTREQLLEISQRIGMGLSEGDLSLISLSTSSSDSSRNGIPIPQPVDLNLIQKSGCEFHPLSTLTRS